jgi:hypothetical protein
MGNMLLPDFLDLENIYDWLIPSSKKRGGAVEACWAHNQELNGSKPFPSIIIMGRLCMPMPPTIFF